MMRTVFAAGLFSCIIAAGAAVSPAAAEGNPDQGKQVFNQCRACHSVEAGQHRVGPSLAGVFGREAGAADGFNRYSDALKNADLVWNEETLDKYLADPRGYLPGNRMTYPGLKDPAKRADIIAYLKHVGQ